VTAPVASARIRIRDQFKHEALSLFEGQGFFPLEVEEQGDGEARFVFGETAEALLPALEMMPREWWAIHASIRGDERA
jgi:hypothetical protein